MGDGSLYLLCILPTQILCFVPPWPYARYWYTQTLTLAISLVPIGALWISTPAPCFALPRNFALSHTSCYGPKFCSAPKHKPERCSPGRSTLYQYQAQNFDCLVLVLSAHGVPIAHIWRLINKIRNIKTIK